jgi:hypothetical protein
MEQAPLNITSTSSVPSFIHGDPGRHQHGIPLDLHSGQVPLRSALRANFTVRGCRAEAGDCRCQLFGHLRGGFFQELLLPQRLLPVAKGKPGQAKIAVDICQAGIELQGCIKSSNPLFQHYRVAHHLTGAEFQISSTQAGIPRCTVRIDPDRLLERLDRVAVIPTG